MICPKCNRENDETSVFCIQCGTRLDGKKECPSCKALLRSDAVYCNVCGARVDGKKVCESCGTAYEGSFCPACGAGNCKETLSKELNLRRSAAQELTKILSLIAACLLLFSSFFVGYRVVLSGEFKEELMDMGGKEAVAEAEDMLRDEVDRPTAIHYIVREIEEISDAADALPSKPSSMERGSFVTLTIAGVVGILTLFANIVIAAVCAIRLLVRTFCGYDASDNVGVCLLSFLFSLFSVTLILGASRVSGNTDDYRVVVSSWFLLLYIPAVCAFVGAVVSAIVGDAAYRERFGSVFLTISGALGSCVAGLLIHFSVGDIVLKLPSVSTYGTGKVRVEMSSLTLFQGIFSATGYQGKGSYSAFNKSVISTDISYCLTIFSLLVATLLCVRLLSGLFVTGKTRISTLAVVESGLLFLFGIAKIVCDAALADAAEGYLAPSIAVSSIPIAFTVLAFLLFGGLLTVRLIKRNSYDLVG